MEEKEMERRADELLDEKAADSGEPKTETEGKRVVDDPGEMLRDLCRGTLKLFQPIRAHGQDVKEIRFDFCALTGIEVMDALDSGKVNNMFTISNGQAIALFAATAEKCAPMIEENGRMTRLYDAKDVLARLSGADSVKAVQLAKLFYNASGQAGNNNISKD